MTADSPPVAQEENSARIAASKPSNSEGTRTNESSQEPVLDAYYLRVLESSSDLPIAGARISLDTRESPQAYCYSDNDGIVRVSKDAWTGTSRKPVEPYAWVVASGYSSVIVLLESVGTSLQTATVIRLRPAGSLAAIIQDVNGTPQPGMRVILSAQRPLLHDPPIEDSGAYNEIKNTGQFSINIMEDGKAKFRGRLGSEEWIEETNTSGEAQFLDLPVLVPLAVRVMDNRHTVLTPDKPLLIAPGERRNESWTIDRSASIRGLLLDQFGIPISGEYVWFVRSDAKMDLSERPPMFRYFSTSESPQFRDRTGQHGQFSLDGCSAGTWFVGPAPAEFARNPMNQDIPGVGQRFDIVSGETKDNIQLSVFRGLFITGSVLSSTTEPIAAAVVMARPLDASGQVISNSGRRGEYRIGPLLPGAVSLVASSPGFIAVSLDDVEAGQSEVNLILDGTCTISGIVVDYEGHKPMRALRTIVSHPAEAWGVQPEVLESPRGSFVIRGLPEGHYAICLFTEGNHVALVNDIEAVPGDPRFTALLAARPSGIANIVNEAMNSISIEVHFENIIVNRSELQPSSSVGIRVPPGSIGITLSSAGQVTRHVINIAAGTESTVRVP